MTSSRMPRVAMILGQYACPLACVAAGWVAWDGGHGHPMAMVGVGLLALTVWLFMRLSARRLKIACEEQAAFGENLIRTQKVLALGELSAGIAHEINNPLNIILQESELVRADLSEPLTPENFVDIRTSLDVIHDQVMRCSEITHKMLDFARDRKPVSQFADLNQLAEDMLTLVERESIPRGIRLVRLLTPDLPGVKTDPPLLRQVILNLLINAVQAVDRGGAIYVTTYERDDMLCLEVRDTGPGVPEELRERIFLPFFTTKPPGQGTGLGLAVSLRITNELGGDILLRSKEGEGAAFTIRIPLKQ